MKALTPEEFYALEVLQRRSAGEFRAVSFTKQYIDIPKEWFMATFSPDDAHTQLYIDRDGDGELHVLRATAHGVEYEAVLNYKDHEKWFKQWEAKTNEP